VLGGEPWLVEQLVVHPALLLLEGHLGDEAGEERFAAGDPAMDDFDP
jgi:hypothetical protein